MNNERAFPSGAIDDRFGGMTLHEWYAGQALAGLLAHASGEDPGKAPAMAWIIADSLMAERAARLPLKGSAGGHDA